MSGPTHTVLEIRTLFFKRPDHGIGHAAVTFRHRTHTGGVAGVYVSWWPKESLSVGLKAIKRQQGSTGGSHFVDKVFETGMGAVRALRGGSASRGVEQIVNATTVNKNLQRLATHKTIGQVNTVERLNPDNSVMIEAGNLYKTSCTHKDYLPGFMLEEETQGAQVWWGLCASRVVEWYDKFIEQNIYVGASLRYSCAAAAVTALQVSGAAAYSPSPGFKVAKFYMASMNLMQWASDIRTKLLALNTEAAWFANTHNAAYNIVKAEFRSTDRTNLWSYQKFREKSRLGWQHPRSSLVKNIDTALTRYHDAGEWEDNFQTKLKQLRKLFEYICGHRRAKPTSKRANAISVLGCQVLGVLRIYNVVYCELSNPDKFL